MKTTKKVLRIVNLVLTFILLGLLLLVVYGKVQMMFTKKDYASLFGYTMFQVASNSMEPAITVDDVILVRIGADFYKDDIISFYHEDAIITHRVISINGDEVVVMGDANNTIDAPINREVVIGKVARVLPNLRVWQQIFTEPRILISLFVTLVLFDFAFSYKGKKQRTENISEEKNKKELSKEEILMKTQKIDLSKLNKILAKNNKKKEIPTNEIITEKDLVKLAKTVDIEELRNLLEINKKQILVMSTEDLKEYKERFKKVNKDIKEMKTPVKNQEILDYTIRLDLKEIQNQISKRVDRKEK